MNNVVKSYENYKEEERLTTNNARRIEFITTAKIFDELFTEKLNILDCAAGTGIYSFYLADKGHSVTATDITPRHIEIINKSLMNKTYKMNTAVLDATNMNVFEDETFDVVLNMGPFYHLIEKESRDKCISESIRVLKKGGILIISYIPRFLAFQYVAMSNSKYLNKTLAKQLIETGVLRQEDEMCFWTDTYYSTESEMEELFKNKNLEIIDHFAQDGLTPMFSEKIDNWNEKQFKIWCDYHYSVCREKSIIGASNHVIIAGKKK